MPTEKPKRPDRDFVMVQVLEPWQRKLWEEAAAKEGLPLAGWCRTVLIEAARAARMKRVK